MPNQNPAPFVRQARRDMERRNLRCFPYIKRRRNPSRILLEILLHSSSSHYRMNILFIAGKLSCGTHSHSHQHTHKHRTKAGNRSRNFNFFIFPFRFLTLFEPHTQHTQTSTKTGPFPIVNNNRKGFVSHTFTPTHTHTKSWQSEIMKTF